MTQDQIYQNIAQRTGGDIYLGVVGPVRSGKSTFIKRFAELMLLPRIKNEARRARAHDELPQSAAGRTIMTTEPKFIPEKAVKLELSGGGSFKARLIDCVGYMVDGALGHEENEAPRLVKSVFASRQSSARSRAARRFCPPESRAAGSASSASVKPRARSSRSASCGVRPWPVSVRLAAAVSCGQRRSS